MDIKDLKLENYRYIDLESKIRATINKNMADETLQNEIKVCNKIIEYSLYLRDAFKILSYKIAIETGKRQKEINSLIFALYLRNCDYLISSYELCTSGFINATIVIQRSIFEANEGMYFLHIKENDRAADLFVKKETQQLSNEERREIKNEFNYFKPSEIRKILYEDTKKTKLNDLYEDISRRAHPSIKSTFASYIEDPEFIRDSLRGIIFVGIANIVAFWEVNYNTFNQYKITKVDFILNKTVKELGVLPYDMIPSNPKIIDKIKIRNYE